MLGALGPRRERGTSATLPDRPPLIEGFVVSAISGLQVGTGNPKTLTVSRGTILCLSWELDGETLVVQRSGRTHPIANLDVAGLSEGTYVRCEYHAQLREYVPYWWSCSSWGLNTPDEGDPYDGYEVIVEDVEE